LQRDKYYKAQNKLSCVQKVINKQSPPKVLQALNCNNDTDPLAAPLTKVPSSIKAQKPNTIPSSRLLRTDLLRKLDPNCVIFQNELEKGGDAAPAAKQLASTTTFVPPPPTRKQPLPSTLKPTESKAQNHHVTPTSNDAIKLWQNVLACQLQLTDQAQLKVTNFKTLVPATYIRIT
jgi:hypothetical protein